MDECNVRRWIRQHPHGLAFVSYAMPDGSEREGTYQQMIQDGGQFEMLITTLNDVRELGKLHKKWASFAENL